MALTIPQKWGISADLNIIKLLGFDHIRLLTFTKSNDPFYDPWPNEIFLSFPVPTVTELDNLREFLSLTKDFGMTSEVVLLMPDSKNHYYTHGATVDDYKKFIDALWPSMWGGLLSRIYLGGDLRLGDNDVDQGLVATHRKWVKDLWPHLVAKCPSCNLGIALYTMHASFWDRAADSIAWIRNNLARAPNYIGCQLYPTSHAALRALGFEKNGRVDWEAMTQDWIDNLRKAAGWSIEICADEFGIEIGAEFTEQDQVDFLTAALETFNKNNMYANLWEFGDHPGIGNFGLITPDRRIKPAATALSSALENARNKGLRPGIQYIPPEWVGLNWLML